MKNKEKYKDELSDQRICSNNSPWRKDICEGKRCYGCALRFLEWCEREAITEQEKEFLKMISTEFKYIARNEDGSLYLYRKKPIKGSYMWFEIQQSFFSWLNKNMFKGIRWEDDEPFCIDDHVKRKEEENEE